jgi:pyruvate dehydrogenase E2 component (dihydrolipoamide acetyltransferase)
VMSCTATFDHRVVDGALGAQFMAAFKKLIEVPITLVI